MTPNEHNNNPLLRALAPSVPFGTVDEILALAPASAERRALRARIEEEVNSLPLNKETASALTERVDALRSVIEDALLEASVVSAHLDRARRRVRAERLAEQARMEAEIKRAVEAERDRQEALSRAASAEREKLRARKRAEAAVAARSERKALKAEQEQRAAALSAEEIEGIAADPTRYLGSSSALVRTRSEYARATERRAARGKITARQAYVLVRWPKGHELAVSFIDALDDLALGRAPTDGEFAQIIRALDPDFKVGAALASAP